MTDTNNCYVPDEILQEKYRGRGIQTSEVKLYQQDGYRIKEYVCGCKFEDKIESFGFSNHWCDKHAPGSRNTSEEL